MKYSLPPAPNDTYKDWAGYQGQNFVPTVRQQLLIDTYLAAEAKGLFYTSDVLAYAIDVLEVTDEVAAIQADSVEGGEVGMDMYYARNCVRAQREWAERTAAFEKIKPVFGLELGTLRVNMKRTNRCVVSAVEDDLVTVTCMRGRKVVNFRTTALNILNCSKDAVEKGWRKESL